MVFTVPVLLGQRVDVLSHECLRDEQEMPRVPNIFAEYFIHGDVL